MNIYALIPLISVIAYIALICIVVTRPLAKVHKVFILYLTVSMLSSFSSFVLHADFFPAQTLHWNRTLLMLGGSVPVIYYHFISVFFYKSVRKRTHLGYAALIVLTIFASQGGMLKTSYVVEGVLYHQFDASFYLLVALGAIFQIMAVYYLVLELRRATDPQDKNRIGYLLTAALIWIVFMLTNLSPVLANYSIDHIGNIANALIISYAILRYDLLNIKLVARRTLAYLIVIMSLAGIYVSAILLGHSLFPDQPLYIILLFASGLALLLALLARPLRYTIQEWVDRFFYRGTYYYRQTLLNFSSRMGNLINLNELADEMLPTISKALRTSKAELLLEDTSSGNFTTQFAYPKVKAKPSERLSFNLDNPIVAWLEKEDSPLDLKQIDGIPQFMGLWQTEKEKLIVSNLELLCPLKSRGMLIGILALGRKQPGTLYSHEDIELVMSLASQAGIIIENARMVDSLKKQQLQVEQLLTQAVLAQEEERERISVDLHDSIAQWLAAASYRAQTVNALLSGNNNNKAKDELDAMESIIDKSLKELRRVVIGLRPPALDELGLTHALRQSLEDLKTDGLNCKFNEVGTPVRLPSSMEIAVYRIVQETLTNIRKHANATKVNLRLQFQEDKILVEVRDDGKGFDLSQTLDSAVSVGHVGLLGMKQRAEMLGGNMKIKTGEGTGTIITLSLPIQNEVEEG